MLAFIFLRLAKIRREEQDPNEDYASGSSTPKKMLERR